MKEEIYLKELRPLLSQVFDIAAKHDIYYFTEFEVGPGKSYTSSFLDMEAGDFVKIITVFSDSRAEDGPRFEHMFEAMSKAYIETDNLN